MAVRRQHSEAKNQDSNGKNEGIHSAVLNLVQSMIFISSMALWFYEDPAEYAANFLYKITDIANKARQPL